MRTPLRALALCSLLTVVACKSKLEGPSPAVAEVTPNAVCRDQLTTNIVLKGSGLSPLVSGGLTDTPKVNLPSVTLRHARNIDDEQGSGETVAIPDDASNPGDSRVRWQSQTEVHFDFFPALQAQPGLYTIQVANKNGQSAELEGALLAVPEPVLTQVDPEVRCADQGTNVVLTGDFFLKQGTSLPTVKLGSVELPASNLTECRALPGNAGIEACKKAVVEIPVDTLSPGQHPVVLTNPGTFACASTEAVILTMVPSPTLTELRPDLICTAQGENTVVATGTGFLRVDGVEPTLLLGAASFPLTLSNCATVEGPARTQVESCTTGTANLPQDAVAAGLHAAVVQNPEPAACASVEVVNLVVAPPPTITQVDQELVCTAEGANTIVVTGTGFLEVAGAMPQLLIGTSTFPTTLSDCAPITGLANQAAQSCTTATAVIPQNDALSAAVHAVKIANPAPAGCESQESISFVVAAPPTISAIQPDLACSENPTVVTVTGTGFLKVDAATPTLMIGTATLSTTLSDCTAVTGPARIALESCTTATATLGGMTLPAGDYAVSITNPQTAACSSTQLVRFAVTPPPVVSTLTPDLVCIAEGAEMLTVSGTGFITIGATLPTATAGNAVVTITGASNCTNIVGTTTGAQSCTTLSATVDQGTAEGVVDFQVQNPGAGCLSAPRAFGLAGAPVLTGANPPGLCSTATGAVTVNVEGSNFFRIGGAQPTVFIQQEDGGLVTLAATVDGGTCTSLSGLSQTAESCTVAQVSVPNTLPEGSHTLYLTNPETAACTSNPVPFNVSSPPTLTGTTPAKVCAQGGFVDLTGSNFAPGMTVRLLSPTPVSADQPVVVNADGTQARATFTGPLQPGGPYSVEVLTGGGGCVTTLAAQLAVTNGPVVFFVDPSVIYNGITTQGTVYASGFSSTGLQVSIRLNGPTADGGVNPEIVVSSSFNPSKANRINFIAPAGLTPGSYDVLVTDDATALCPGVLLNAFQVTDQLTLELTAIDPAFGHAGSDTAVTIFADAGTQADGGTTGFLPLPRFYLNPAQDGGIAIPLESVALIDPSRSTAVVPTGQTVGTYSLIAVNPTGAVGLLPDSFKVVPDPLVEIDAVSPGSLLLNTADQPFSATGRNFRTGATVTFRCIDATITNPPIVEVPATSVTVAADGLSLSGLFSNTFQAQQVCLVRVGNTDGTFADFSSVVLTNPAQKLTPSKAGNAMILARRAPVTLGGAATRAAQFVYAIGGDDGASVVHDTVEAAPLDPFGNPGSYALQRNRLTTPRTLAAGERVGRFLYVGGGRSAQGASGTVLSSVERAYILDPADRVEITDADFNVVEGGAGLTAGVYYYRVAAVLDNTSSLNKDGENLPSDPFPISVPSLSGGGAALSVTLNWTSTAGAALYRVYRTVNANDPAGSELLIGEVIPTSTTFTDDGLVTPGTVGPPGLRPLAIGATGTWQVVGEMPDATGTGVLGREGLAATTADDPSVSGNVHLYFAGGRDSAGTLLNTHVSFPIAVATHGVGAPVAGVTTFATARWQHAALTANKVNAPVVGNNQYVYILGGIGGTGPTGSLQAALVGPGGALGTFGSASSSGMNPTRAGFAHALANDFIFALGGADGAPDERSTAAKIGASPPAVGSWSDAVAILQRKRYLVGSTLHGAFIYVQGGQTDTEAATRSTEQIIW